jgi:transcriptional regulator with XRE-family HTH domain
MNAGIDGELVRKLRTAKSWSQEELGEISGLSARTIQRIEVEGSGSLDSRRALASAFGLKPEDLLAAQSANVAAEAALDGNPTYVDRPRLGVGFGALLWVSAGISLVAILLSILVVVLGVSSRRGPPPISPTWVWLGGQLLLGVSAYVLWVTANTTYRLSAQGLQVHYGPYRRNYRWDQFAMAHWRRGIVPARLAFQPVTRFSDVVTLETHDGSGALDLTPRDPEDFMRQIAALAPQLAHSGNR